MRGSATGTIVESKKTMPDPRMTASSVHFLLAAVVWDSEILAIRRATVSRLPPVPLRTRRPDDWVPPSTGEVGRYAYARSTATDRHLCVVGDRDRGAAWSGIRRQIGPCATGRRHRNRSQQP